MSFTSSSESESTSFVEVISSSLPEEEISSELSSMLFSESDESPSLSLSISSSESKSLMSSWNMKSSNALDSSSTLTNSLGELASISSTISSSPASTNSLGDFSSTNSISSSTSNSSPESLLTKIISSLKSSPSGGITSTFSPKLSFLASASFFLCSSNSFSRFFLNSSARFWASILRFSSFSRAILCSSRVSFIDFSMNSNNFLRPKSRFLYQSVDHKW